MQYVKVFWKKKSKKFTARTGGKFAVNDSFLEKKFVENYFKKAKSQHGKVLINAKGCGIKSEAGLLRKLSSKVKETQYEEDVGHTGAGHAFGACADGRIGAGGACGKQRSIGRIQAGAK